MASAAADDDCINRGDTTLAWLADGDDLPIFTRHQHGLKAKHKAAFIGHCRRVWVCEGASAGDGWCNHG